MASHLSSIGIPMNSQSDFQEYFEKTYNSGEHIKVAQGTYLKWKLGDDVELWGQMNNNNEAIGMNPHFSGTSRMKVVIKEKVISANDNELDGAFLAYTNPQTDENEAIGYPLVFDVPNMCTYGNLKLPQIVDIQLAAFAQEIKGFATDEEYFASQSGEMKFAVESFIPSGMFSANGETTSPPLSQAIFSGRIIDSKMCINKSTSKAFFWAKVSVLGDEIDVVADPEIFVGQLVNGGVISGSFWLSGKIVTTVNTEAEEKKPFWKKIFGK